MQQKTSKDKYSDNYQDNYGIGIFFDEFRSGPDTRTEVLSTVFGTRFYQGKKSNTDWGKRQSISINAQNGAKGKFFVGTYQVINASEENYKLSLVGDIVIDFDVDGTPVAFQDISTVLNRVNISN